MTGNGGTNLNIDCDHRISGYPYCFDSTFIMKWNLDWIWNDLELCIYFYILLTVMLNSLDFLLNKT